MTDSIQKLVLDLVRQRDLQHTDPDVVASDYWKDFCAHFRYVFSLDAEEAGWIRRHAYHLTSDIYQRYYFASPEYRDLLIRGHRFFLDQLDGLALDEGERGIGVDGPSGRVSHDLLRYLGVLVDLVDAGALNRREPRRVLEIGGGYGGLARSVLTYNAATAYVICDLEETLVFSGLYLSQMLGRDRVHVLHSPRPLAAGHVHLVAQSRLGDLEDQQFDLVINQQSMQEMSDSQVRRYCRFIQAHAERFFVCNLDSHADDLVSEKNIVSSLDALLGKYFTELLWVGEPRSDEWRFGDNTLRRQLFRAAASGSA